MPRRRGTRSSARIQKKILKLDSAYDGAEKSPKEALEPEFDVTNTPKCKGSVSCERPRRTQISRTSHQPSSSPEKNTSPIGNTFAFVSAGPIGKEMPSESDEHDTDPLNLKMTIHHGHTAHPGFLNAPRTFPEEEDENVDASEFVSMKMEVDDEGEVSLGRGERVCLQNVRTSTTHIANHPFQHEEESIDDPSPITITAIKVEEVDCGVLHLDHIGEVKQADLSKKMVAGHSGGLSSSIISEVQRLLNSALPQDWFCKETDNGFNVMLLSRCQEKAIQRRIFFPFEGGVQVSVHRKPLQTADVGEFLAGLLPVLSICESSYTDFVKQALKIVERLWCLEICGGADKDLINDLLLLHYQGTVDTNPYGEIRYERTFRSLSCKLLVNSNRWMCNECNKTSTAVRKRQSQLGVKNMETKIVVDSAHPEKMKVNTQVHIPNLTNSLLKKLQKPPEKINVEIRKSSKIKNQNLPLVTACNKPYSLKGGALQVYSTTVCGTPFVEEKSPLILNQTSSSTEKSASVAVTSAAQTKTNNVCLTTEEIGVKILGTDIRDLVIMTAEQSRIEKIRECIKLSGVPVEKDFAEDLMNILKDVALTSIQQQFIESQSNLANYEKGFGIRWHPTLIRFALMVRSTSSEKHIVAGMITLPSGKKLFNFSQVLFKPPGFQKADVKEILQKPYLQAYDLSQSHYILLLDEIDVIENLVYQRSNGELIGFVKLSDIKTEMDQLEENIQSYRCVRINQHQPISMLVYMVKGLCNGFKEVVGLLPNSVKPVPINISERTVFDTTWDVIGTLEECGLKVIALVSSGFSRTKSFLNLHPPSTWLESGQVYVTKNSKAPSRSLYFFIDASYLLKQIRDCFEKSVAHGHDQNCKTLTRNKETIEWKTIVNLYLSQNMKCPNLNDRTVYLNKYSRKKASYAASVMSIDVAKCLESKVWPNTTETVNFITKVHEFFMCLVNTDVAEGKNPSQPFVPYSGLDDRRYSKLMAFLDYLRVWKQEIELIPHLSSEDKTRMHLDVEIFQELEVSVRSFIDIAQFLFKNGVCEVDPNVFFLEPLGKYLENRWFGFVQTV